MPVSEISRPAVYGPVRTVVWEGRSREAPPIPIFVNIATFCCAVEFGRHRGIADIEQAAPAKPELRLRALVNCPSGKSGESVRPIAPRTPPTDRKIAST